MKKALVLGGGFSGLACATHLGKQGFDVTLLEKNDQIGGRARKLEKDGYTFDMGPSWYWMPDVFEGHYNHFGHTTSDFYELVRLDPSYRVYWDDGYTDLPADLEKLYGLFEHYEPGSSKFLKKFLKDAEYKYKVGMKEFVYKPSLSIREFMDPRLFGAALKMDLFKSIERVIRGNLKNEKLIQLLSFPVLFLGAMPSNTPALYSLMNYADMKLGTWFPIGGMYKIIDAFIQIAEEQGVKIITGSEVESLSYRSGRIESVQAGNQKYQADLVINAMDYHHFEQRILDEPFRDYSQSYWEKRTMAPSCLLYYVGVNKKINGLEHHNLFFDADFDLHSREIYDTHKWPKDPLFYASCSSKTDPSSAPPGCENLFLLIPISTSLENDQSAFDTYFEKVLDRLERHTGEKIRDHIQFKINYGPSNFKSDYNAFRGNAYGLANTLSQTALLKPRIKNKKLKNLYYCGQLTVPGPGVPPSIISGELVANYINQNQLN